jgi:hypothetical protein
MNNKSAARLFALCLVAGTLLFGGWAKNAPIPVRVGQKEVDAKKLPFACITIGIADVRVPLEKVVVEDVESHKEYAGQMGKLFTGARPEYPYGGDEKRRVLSMAILALPAGRYRLKMVEFTPESQGSVVNYMIMNLPDSVDYRFTVKAGCVNYVGSIIFSADWSLASHGAVEVQGGIVKSFEVERSVEHTEKRDRKWANTLIPGLAALPWQDSPFGGVAGK